MTRRQFFNAVAGGGGDVLKRVLSLLAKTKTPYCVIGGLAVNAYAEPVVSLDLDLVVSSAKLAEFLLAAKRAGFKAKVFKCSINLSAPGSDLRIQLQTDERYQPFISRAKLKTVLGYRMKVAAVEDVLQGKIWAHGDASRRMSKRQKDLADIMRLLEKRPRLRKTAIGYESLMRSLKYAHSGRKFSRDEMNER
ncbi:MAG: hypothetical protein FJY83_02955 [Candidatus Aminicenantes bacterium]|nr:hypothetical protein [Candidatus Aminicenantes bacterium]